MVQSNDLPIYPIKEIPIRYAKGVAGLCSLLLIFAYLAVSLRMYTRVFINRKVGSDDVFVLVALLTFTCLCILLPILGDSVAGKNKLTINEMTFVTNMLMALEAFYVVTIAFFKVSFGLFFLRISSLRWQRVLVTWILIIFSLFSFAYFFFAIFQCGVPHGSSFWRNRLAGHCVTRAQGLGMGYVHAALTAGSDFVFLFLPIPIVQQSSMKMSEKVVMVFILGLGTIGSIASLVRIKWVPDLVNNDNTFFYDGIYLAIWSAIEPGLGIIASSTATLRPLFTRWLRSFQEGRGSTLVASLKSINLIKSKQTDSKSKSVGFTSRGSTLVSTLKSLTHDKTRDNDTKKPGLLSFHGAKTRLQSSFVQTFIREPSPASIDRRSWSGPASQKQDPMMEENQAGFYPDYLKESYRSPPDADPTPHAEAMQKREEAMLMKGRLIDARQRTGFSLGIFEGKSSEELYHSESGVLRSATLSTDIEQRPQPTDPAPLGAGTASSNASIAGASQVSDAEFDSSYPINLNLTPTMSTSDVNRTSWHSSSEADSGVLGRLSGL